MFSSLDDNYNNSIGNISTNVNNNSIPILEQQIKLLKKELKSKDEKISRLTDHAVMMGNHMDKLKGEVLLYIFISAYVLYMIHNNTIYCIAYCICL